ncbi:MAG: aryl-sulfate sulfotransferase, partial [Candidatus Poseidonia sp.]|nr:aryl-sulfate sulfotransferase [Poseidonia sp.]
DETKDNYGVVAQHPERININYVGATGNQAGRADWMHCNGIDYNAVLDQIAISCRGMNEIYVIDHSTTTEEAAGHSGGNYGKGGDLLYRWGNPQVYGKGLSSDQQLFAQHDVQWIGEGHPNAGDLIVFNNGVGRAVPYSSVEILNTSYANGTYPLLPNGTFGPPTSTWSWNQGEAMYSGAISGAQALPNGHLLVTHGTKGTLYEVNQSGGIVWEYINPVGSGEPYVQGEALPDGNRAGTTLNAVFKATHYPPTYEAFTGRLLTSGTYIENWTDMCPNETSWGWDRNGDGCIDDSDSDGVLDPYDQCSLGDDGTDADSDNIPDACDGYVDSDMDGVLDEDDLCQGHDDDLDNDADGVPDGCDALVDTDNDGVEDDKDLCDGSDDDVDLDKDGLPDGCDELIDGDFDGVADAMDTCPNTTPQTADGTIDENGCSPNQLDGDVDGVSDADDRCEGHDDTVDSDDDGVPDGCELQSEGTPEEEGAVSQRFSNTRVALYGGVVLLATAAILLKRKLN